MQNKEIQIPSFINKVDDLGIRRLVRDLASGDAVVYAQKENEVERVYLDSYIKDSLINLYERLDNLKKSNVSSKRKKIKQLNEKIKKLNNYKTYCMYTSVMEAELEMLGTSTLTLENDIAQMSTDVLKK